MRTFKKFLGLGSREGPAAKPRDPEQSARQLLRENLRTIRVDLFAATDPVLAMKGEERRLYLKHYYDIEQDGKVAARLKHLINLQAGMTLATSDHPSFDMAGAMTGNGLSVAMEDIEKLSALYQKEYLSPVPTFNKMGL